MSHKLFGRLITENTQIASAEGWDGIEEWQNSRSNENILYSDGFIQLINQDLSVAFEDFFLGDDTGEISRYDENFDEVWTTTLANSSEVPTAIHPEKELVIVGCNEVTNDSLTVHDLNDGTKLHGVATGPVNFIPLVVHDRIIVYHFNDNQVYNYDLTLGNVSKSPAGGFFANPTTIPLYNNFYIYIGMANGRLWVLDMDQSQDGRRLSNKGYATFPTEIASNIALHENDLFFGTAGDMFYRVTHDDNNDLQTVWSIDISAYGTPRETPATFDGMIYVPADDNIVAISAENGNIQWSYQTRDFVNNPPVIFDNVIYTTSTYYDSVNSESEQWIYAINLDGTEYFEKEMVFTGYGTPTKMIGGSPNFVRDGYYYTLDNEQNYNEGALQRRELTTGNIVDESYLKIGASMNNQTGIGLSHGWAYNNMAGRANNTASIGGL